MTILIDATGRLINVVAGVERSLPLQTNRVDEEAAISAVSAAAVARLGTVLADMLTVGPVLLAPTGHKLADLADVPSEVVCGARTALASMLDARRLTERVAGPEDVLALFLAASLAQDGGSDGRVLADIIVSGGSRGRWTAPEPATGSPGSCTERWHTRLSTEEYQVYRRYAAAVLLDPNDRFAATGEA